MFALLDVVSIVLAYTAALVLRFVDIEHVPADWWRGFFVALPLIACVHLGFNLVFGAYGHVWEFASIDEALRIVFAAVASFATLLGGLLLYRIGSGHSEELIPLLVLPVGAGLTLGAMGASRFHTRLFTLHNWKASQDSVRTLVVGTGRAAADLARHTQPTGRPLKALAFVSPNGDETLLRLAGLPVAGSLSDVPRLIQELAPDQVVVASHISDAELRALVDRCMESDVPLRILPDLDQVLSNGTALGDIRDLELSDLLPRQQVTTDLGPVAATLRSKTVLVTGAGGSIGSEIVSQILEFEPAKVVALDNDETHLYDAGLEWASSRVVPALCDIRDDSALERVLRSHRPTVVFHAAALKHVPLLEAFPEEAAKTNVVGTARLLEALRKVDLERFVLISTDKAVAPSSAMGASKRIAEMLVQAEAASGTVCSAVRFGNVLGSRGSVVPTFVKQIKSGGPVTVSDPAMSRYFMTISEAVQLVLQASAISTGGEVFVLEMGEPVQIGDLARRMIRLAGLVPGRDIQIRVTGARPGEKMQEILSLEPLTPSSRPQIGIAQPAFPSDATLRNVVMQLERLAKTGERELVRDILDNLGRQRSDTEVVVDLTKYAAKKS